MQQYDPGQHYAVFNGVRITGFAGGTYIKAARKTETWSDAVGAGGEVTRVRSRDERGTVTFTLMASSPTNDQLSALASQDEVTGDADGQLSIIDGSGTTVVTASQAWIVKPADVEMSVELPDREWMIACAQLEMLVGGNAG